MAMFSKPPCCRQSSVSSPKGHSSALRGHGVWSMIMSIRNSYEEAMRISERGQITIPKPLRERFGMNHNVEVEVSPTEQGLLIRKRAADAHPVDRVAGILDGTDFDIDEYLEEIRGR